jgi:hypothetical protein
MGRSRLPIWLKDNSNKVSFGSYGVYGIFGLHK